MIADPERDLREARVVAGFRRIPESLQDSCRQQERRSREGLGGLVVGPGALEKEGNEGKNKSGQQEATEDGLSGSSRFRKIFQNSYGHHFIPE